MERNILLTIEYDGTNYSGWQRQPNATTVQGEVEKALSLILGYEIQVQGTSRTDAGVHALDQKANFKGTFGIPTEKIKFALNNALPKGIYIKNVEEKPAEFHARFHTKGKGYVYKIRNSEERNVFERNFCYHVPKPLNLEAMLEAAKDIVGTYDFKSFQAAGGEEKETTVRQVYSLDIKEDGEFIYITIFGDGFLYKMVRIIAGTLVDIGLGKISPAKMKEIIHCKDRRMAGHTAPPQGLYLLEVYY